MIKHKKFDMKYFFIEQALGNFGEIWGIYEFRPCPQIVPNIPQKCLPRPHPNFWGISGNFP
jgi:hypothetical protein